MKKTKKAPTRTRREMTPTAAEIDALVACVRRELALPPPATAARLPARRDLNGADVLALSREPNVRRMTLAELGRQMVTNYSEDDLAAGALDAIASELDVLALGPDVSGTEMGVVLSTLSRRAAAAAELHRRVQEASAEHGGQQ